MAECDVRDDDWLAARFEEHRARLNALAYRMLSSRTEAEDTVQDAWLRVSRSHATGVANLGSWLTTVVSRLCLNVLQSRRARPEVPFDLEALEPIASQDERSDPEQEAVTLGAVAIRGSEQVARSFVGKLGGARPAMVNGSLGAVWIPGGQPRVVFTFEVSGERITAVTLIADKERLQELELDFETG